MTSNLGSQMIQQMSGDDYGVIKMAVMAEVKTYFRPEFINRIDEVVVFHALDEKHIAGIAKIQLGYLEKRLAQLEMGIVVEDSALAELAQAGFDPVFGARPLRRAVRYLQAVERVRGKRTQLNLTTAQMEQQMAALPPAVREKMQQMTGGGAVTVTKGVTKKVAGYDCQDYDVSMGGLATMHLCATTAIAPPSPAASGCSRPTARRSPPATGSSATGMRC